MSVYVIMKSMALLFLSIAFESMDRRQQAILYCDAFAQTPATALLFLFTVFQPHQ